MLPPEIEADATQAARYNLLARMLAVNYARSHVGRSTGEVVSATFLLPTKEVAFAVSLIDASLSELPPRPLRDQVHARSRRHGRSLPRPRLPPEPRCCHQ